MRDGFSPLVYDHTLVANEPRRKWLGWDSDTRGEKNPSHMKNHTHIFIYSHNMQKYSLFSSFRIIHLAPNIHTLNRTIIVCVVDMYSYLKLLQSFQILNSSNSLMIQINALFETKIWSHINQYMYCIYVPIAPHSVKKWMDQVYYCMFFWEYLRLITLFLWNLQEIELKN